METRDDGSSPVGRPRLTNGGSRSVKSTPTSNIDGAASERMHFDAIRQIHAREVLHEKHGGLGKMTDFKECTGGQAFTPRTNTPLRNRRRASSRSRSWTPVAAESPSRIPGSLSSSRRRPMSEEAGDRLYKQAVDQQAKQVIRIAQEQMKDSAASPRMGKQQAVASSNRMYREAQILAEKHETRRSFNPEGCEKQGPWWSVVCVSSI